jgi:hypothetical protein
VAYMTATKIINGVTVNGGYLANELVCQKTKKRIHVLRHRLVAWVFKRGDYTEERSVVDHINGIKSNNRVDNLR